MIPYEWLEAAAERIAPHVVETPLTYDEDRRLFLKWENRQVTGSFKARGALNKVLALEEWERAAGLVAASAGNHGQGVALAGQLTNSPVEVFAPEHAPARKIDAMRGLGARVQLVPGGYGEAEAAAKEYAGQHNKTFVSPYNDAQIIAGQGTAFLEAIRQLNAMGGTGKRGGSAETAPATWIVPVGGGGLVASCGIVVQAAGRADRVIGVQAAASAFAHSLYHRGTQVGVEDGPTLADGLSGAIDDDSVTIPLLKRYVNDMVVVSEQAIAGAIAFAWHTYRERIEGSGAAGLAPILSGQLSAKPSIVMVSGGNIDDSVFERIIAQQTRESAS